MISDKGQEGRGGGQSVSAWVRSSGRLQRFDYGDPVIAEEHILIPKPGRSGELDAWVLGTTFDARRQKTVFNLLDAARIEAGPIAQATLPYVLPLGFHGNFTAA